MILNSRIADRLCQKDGVSYDTVGAVRVEGRKDDKNSMLNVYAIYAPENAEKIQSGFKEEIERFIKDGINAADFENIETKKILKRLIS